MSNKFFCCSASHSLRDSIYSSVSPLSPSSSPPISPSSSNYSSAASNPNCNSREAEESRDYCIPLSVLPPRSKAGEDASAVLISDDELYRLSVRQLNQRLQGHDVKKITEMKKKRRVLKNRGYAYSCRQRRIENQLGLECENNQLKTHVRHLELLLSDLQARLAYYEHSAALSSNNTLLLPTSNLQSCDFDAQLPVRQMQSQYAAMQQLAPANMHTSSANFTLPQAQRNFGTTGALT